MALLVSCVSTPAPSHFRDVWNIQCGDYGGTAFVVAAENSELLLLTAFHVIDPIGPLTAECWDGRQLTDGKLLIAWEAEDLAIVSFPDTTGTQSTPFSFGTRLQMGQRVTIPSYPSPTFLFFITQGIVSQRGYCSADAFPGSSGAPVLNRAGQVVGVVNGIVNGPISWMVRFQPTARAQLPKRIAQLLASAHQGR